MVATSPYYKSMQNSQNAIPINSAKSRLAEKLRRALGSAILDAIDDPNIIEILLNPDGHIWTDQHIGGMVDTGLTMSVTQAENLIGTVAAALNTVSNSDYPLLQGELPINGERFQGILPPISAAPVWSIRKRAPCLYTLDDYREQDILTESQADTIRQAVVDKKNIVIAGGCSSGKTTLANAVLAEAVSSGNPAERFVILEDTVELQCAAVNAVALRTGETADMTQLLRATLRLRPDRIIVGEVRGGEALALLKAWGTGHPGGITTLHANSAQGALIRLEQLIQEAGVPPQPALIAEAVDLIIFIARTPDGRRVKHTISVQGYSTDIGYSFTKGN